MINAVTVVRVPTVVTVAAAGVQGKPGTGTDAGSFNPPTSIGGVLTETITSNWGIDPSGNPYYDPAGAAPADAAIASLDAGGNLVLTDTRGGSVVVAVTSVNGYTGTAVVLVKADVGLGNVDNTSNATERAATATLANKTLTSPVVNSPTGIVKADVGLGSVTNTADSAKPVSTAQQAALDLKANIASLAAVATTGAYADLTGKPTIPSPGLVVALAVALGS